MQVTHAHNPRLTLIDHLPLASAWQMRPEKAAGVHHLSIQSINQSLSQSVSQSIYLSIYPSIIYIYIFQAHMDSFQWCSSLLLGFLQLSGSPQTHRPPRRATLVPSCIRRPSRPVEDPSNRHPHPNWSPSRERPHREVLGISVSR